MGARTDAARSEVVARRAELAEEVVRLEASGRAAIDIPSRIRRAPAQTLGAAAGAAFLLFGGPGRVLRRVNRIVRGPQADLPKALLPKDIERALRSVGSDGERVRGAIERDFARYLASKGDVRKERELTGVAAILLGLLLKPAATRAGRQLAEALFDPDPQGFADALAKARARTRTSGGTAPAAGGAQTAAAAGQPPASIDQAPANTKAGRDKRRKG